MINDKDEQEQIKEFEKVFAQLKAMLYLSDDIMIRLNNTFFETVSLTLEQLKDAIQKKDDEAIERHAHSIKGSSASLCYAKISEIAEGLEKSAHAKENSLYAEEFGKLSEVFSAASHGYTLWKNKKGQY